MTPFSPTPPALLADAFASHVVLWAKEKNADEQAMKWLPELARQLSLAVSAGHVCLPLETMPEQDKQPPLAVLRKILLASGLVGSPGTPGNLPMVLDKENRLYLHRYFAYERTLAERLLSLNETLPIDKIAARQSLSRFFSPIQTTGADWQRLAAALALRQRLTVISGGPGTGKTTTVAAILACLLFINPQTRITLAAPTGKAAMRMLEAIRSQTGRFPKAIQAAMPKEAFTLHRLLQATSRPGVFRRHAGRPLTLDVLVVDEASMVDLALACHLLTALPAHARLIMLGDKDQLAAVEAGAVFAELSASPALTPACIADLAAMTGIPQETISPPGQTWQSPWQDNTVWLTQNFRFSENSGISRLALAVREGNTDTARAVLANVSDGSLTWLPDENAAVPDGTAMAWAHKNYAAYLKTVNTRPKDKAAAFKAFERFRVLCALREGPCGADAINAQLSDWFREKRKIPQQETWYTGRPVMVRQNDYSLRLFNGDIGLVLPDDQGKPAVWFPDGPDEFRAIPPARLPAHETAFAMTVHQSQGSEFETLLILMPPVPGPLLTRELLYTAITRARQHVWLACTETVLHAAVRASVHRHSGLAARMRETCA